MNYHYEVTFNNGRSRTVVVFAHFDKRADEKIKSYFPKAFSIRLKQITKYL